ncbi:MAG TPA: GNAT family N-acetyltransferase [Rudaea sp.]|nr:GNAT family N-acetyltransferase [Rudaea sp.]
MNAPKPVQRDAACVQGGPATPRLETPRLLLRPLQLDDFDAWAELSADAETMRFLGGVQPRSVAWRSFLFVAGGWSLQGFAPFSVIEKASGRWIGRVGPLCPEGWPGTEIGWTIARHVWGRGYASEAAEAATDWAFRTLGWTEIIHCIHADHAASQAVARKLGSSPLRTTRMPPPFEDEVVGIWVQSSEEWFARHKAATT